MIWFLHFAWVVISQLDLAADFGWLSSASTCSCVTNLKAERSTCPFTQTLNSRWTAPSFSNVVFEYNPCRPVICGEYDDVVTCLVHQSSQWYCLTGIGDQSAMYFVAINSANQILLHFQHQMIVCSSSITS